MDCSAVALDRSSLTPGEVGGNSCRSRSALMQLEREQESRLDCLDTACLLGWRVTLQMVAMGTLLNVQEGNSRTSYRDSISVMVDIDLLERRCTYETRSRCKQFVLVQLQWD